MPTLLRSPIEPSDYYRVHIRPLPAHSPRAALTAWLVGAASLAVCACSPRAPVTTARVHVERLAGAIGSRPVGTEPNRLARDYLVGQLRAAGFEVRVQEANAERPGHGVTARVANVIALRPGARRDAIALMAHYDCVPDGPGAADDGFGVAVCLEAGRRLAARRSPKYTTVIILTDGEELGLMGAAAVLEDPIRRRVRAALNFEAIGSGSPVLLFETGVVSGGLVASWARHAPFPAGASFMPAIYKAISIGGDRTDLGLFRRAGFAGLDFASVGDSYTYHTLLDTPARLDMDALDRSVGNAVAVVEALDRDGFAGPAGAGSTYFDVLGRWAVSYGHTEEFVALGLAILVGAIAWFHLLGVARRSVRTSTIVLSGAWLVVGAVGVAASMLAAAWLLRATRSSLHPWYAHPDPFFASLLLAGVAAVWVLVRAGGALPASVRGSMHPAVIWVMTLPAWIVLSIAAGLEAPGAAFLVVWPLLAAGVALPVFSVGRRSALAVASALVAVVVAVLWLPSLVRLLHFAVAELGRGPFVTPIVVYPALLLACALVLAPPALALASAAAGASRLLAGWIPGAALIVGACLTFAWSWTLPAYTPDRPLRHVIRYVADMTAGRAQWESGSNEAAPPARNWGPGPFLPERAHAIGPLPEPFVYHAPAPAPDAAPFRVTASVARDADVTLQVRAVPKAQGWTVAFVLAPGVIPVETNLPIAMRGGRQVAVFHAVPSEGVTFTGRFALADAGKLAATTTILAMGNGIPGAQWPMLPGWLPQSADVWQARSYYVLPIEWADRPTRQ